jgi:predicted MPP superfamily phosphohydrolase
MFCALYQLILKFTQISSFNSKILTIIIPIIITIYSLIKAQILYFQEETLIYEGYNNSIKIMHISDMHLGAIYQKRSVENLVKIINQQYPDVVVITGDISDGSLKVESDWLQPFNDISENIEVLYITGNHEHLYGKNDIISEILKIKKIKYIGNSDEIIKLKGVNFIGMDFDIKM